MLCFEMGERMILKDLVEQCANDTDTRFQVTPESYQDWGDYEEVWSYSPLLEKFWSNEIQCLTAIKENVFRFVLKGV